VELRFIDDIRGEEKPRIKKFEKRRVENDKAERMS